MTNEIRVQIGLQVRKGDLFSVTQPSAFIADMAGSMGETPGGLTVPLGGANVDLSHLTKLGGFIWMQNLDTVNYIEWGVYDPLMGLYIPVGELLPGEFCLWRMSHFLGDYSSPGTGTGTGTSGHGVMLRLKATQAPCQALVKAYDK
jgi:hypothetical protein